MDNVFTDGVKKSKFEDFGSDTYKFDRICRGLVIDDRDPRDVGRLKIWVPGVYSDLSLVDDNDATWSGVADKLPWAIPALGLYRSGGSNIKVQEPSDVVKGGFNNAGAGGLYTVPAKGNKVYLWFDQGNHMRPVYFAMCPGEKDWLDQKINIKNTLTDKIDQIKTFVKKFVPVQGTGGTYGTDWASAAFVNSRQRVSSGGQSNNPAAEDKNFEKEGINQVFDGNYVGTVSHNDNTDENGPKSKNMANPIIRARTNMPSLDVKNLFDKEDTVQPKRTYGEPTEEDPHKYPEDWKEDNAAETGRNINRHVTTLMTEAGTAIVIDNRFGQENFYLIHKGYLKNIDENGSVKEYVGTNFHPITETQERCDKETGVEGDYKIHVLGNFVTYIKGNEFKQIDGNVQIDCNNSYGVRLKKGDFDIIVEGDEPQNTNARDGNDDKSQREGGKDRQQGDVNIDIQNGQMTLHVKKAINIHSEDSVNLWVEKHLRTTVWGDHHLFVKGDSYTYIQGNKYETVEANVENRYNVGWDVKKDGSANAQDRVGNWVKTEIMGSEFRDIGGDSSSWIKGNHNQQEDQTVSIIYKKGRSILVNDFDDLTVQGTRRTKVLGGEELSVGGDRITNVGQTEKHLIGLSLATSIGTTNSLEVRATNTVNALMTDFTGPIKSKGAISVGNSVFCTSLKVAKAGGVGGTPTIQVDGNLSVKGSASIGMGLSSKSLSCGKVSCDGNDIGAPGTSLLKHTHGFNWWHGGGHSNTQLPKGGSAAGAPVPQIETGILYLGPSLATTAISLAGDPNIPEPASMGTNDGGGKVESNPEPTISTTPNRDESGKEKITQVAQLEGSRLVPSPTEVLMNNSLVDNIG
jgi:hypothetical protein